MPRVELGEPAGGADLGVRRAGCCQQGAGLVLAVLGDEPASELLLGLRVESLRSEGRERVDPRLSSLPQRSARPHPERRLAGRAVYAIERMAGERCPGSAMVTGEFYPRGLS